MLIHKAPMILFLPFLINTVVDFSSSPFFVLVQYPTSKSFFCPFFSMKERIKSVAAPPPADRLHDHWRFYGGGFQSIGGLIQFDSEGIVGVAATSLANEDLGKVGIDSPISDLVGMSHSIARHISSEAHVVEFPLSRTQTYLDV